MTDAEWAVALAREAAVALFVVRTRPPMNGGTVHLDSGRPCPVEPGGQTSLPDQPTVR